MLLFIDGNSSNFTVYLENPIKNPKTITLHRCAFTNEWKNLPTDGTATTPLSVLTVPAGFYYIHTLAGFLAGATLQLLSIDVQNSTITASQNLELNDSLADLVGLTNKTMLSGQTHQIKMKSLETVFVKNDLVDTYKSLKQGKPSKLLSFVPMSGGFVDFRPFFPIKVQTVTVDFVSSLNFSIRDSEDNLVEGLYPISLLLEIT